MILEPNQNSTLRLHSDATLPSQVFLTQGSIALQHPEGHSFTLTCSYCLVKELGEIAKKIKNKKNKKTQKT